MTGSNESNQAADGGSRLGDDARHAGQPQYPPVFLSDFAGEMDCQADEMPGYLDRRTGEVVFVPYEAFSALENDADERGFDDFSILDDELIETAREIEETDFFVQLPDKFEINEWSIMRDFCLSVDDTDSQSELMDAIHGSGAFRSFKSTVDRLGMREAWFRFRDEELEKIAIRFFDEHGIAWTRAEPDK